MRSLADHRLPLHFMGLSVAGLLAHMLGYVALAWVASLEQAMAFLGAAAAAITLPVFIARTWDGSGLWMVGFAVASAGSSLALVLLGLLTYGPLFAPALVLWAGAAAVGVRAQRPPALAVATAALWGLGMTMVLTVLAVTIASLRA